MSVTINDIAALAGVSRGTVDRVLHNRPNVHPLVRRKVQEAILVSGYEPPDARRIDRLSKKLVLIAPPWTDSYFNRQLSKGMHRAQRYLNDAHVVLTEHLMRSRAGDELLRAIDEQINAGADGLIIRPENTPVMLQKIEDVTKAGIPVVTYDADVPGSSRICHVGQDLLRSGAIAAGIMARQMRPRERVLIITGDMRLEAHKGRVDGFVQHILRLGFPADCYQLEECYELPEYTAEVVHRRLDADPMLRYIYMATQSISGCMAGIRQSTRAPHPPRVICNDLTPTAKKYLAASEIDYVIGQAFDQESFKSFLALYQLLIVGRKPDKETFYTDLSIISKEML